MPGRKRPASDDAGACVAPPQERTTTVRRSSARINIKNEPRSNTDELKPTSTTSLGKATCVEDEHLTEYEKERAAQIARNKQRMAELALPELAAELADIGQKEAKINHQRAEEKGAANKRARKADRQAGDAAPRRTSLRVRGIKAEGNYAGGIEEELRGGQIILKSGSYGSESAEGEDTEQRHPTGPLPFKSNFGHEETDAAFLEHLRRTAAPLGGERALSQEEPVDRHSAAKLQLQEQHVAKVTRNGTTYLEFRPSVDQLMLAAGDKDGNVSLWDVDYSKLEGASEDFDGVITFPGVHREYISSLRWAGPSNLITAAYDGSIRLLDINREASSCFVDLTAGLQEGLEISAMDVQTDLQGSSSNSGCCSVAYVADKDGDLHVVDLRAGTAVHGKPLDLHNRKINTLHLEPTGAPLLLSASTDSSVKVWDVRKLAAAGNGRVQAVASMHHTQSCQAAHWAPDGSKRIVSSSFDNTLKVWNPSGLSLPTTSVDANHTTQGANKNKKDGGAGKRLWQGTISKFFGPAASRAAGGPSSSPSAANTRKRGAAGSGSHVASKPGQAGAPAAATASADGRGGLPQGEVKGSWSQALSIKHNNNTGRWVTPFKAIWGAASDIIIVGNMNRGVDVFDALSGTQLAVLCRTEAMTAIPSRIAVHPTRHVLAASTASGRVHMWR
uniref:DNA damage-binding protein CMR1 n=1 Tax=Dunaliella tertiolecta TaxID=3047 RepID=A0A7S3RAJ2_DUNTE|mmetsp:Transcript_18520/g.51995  ORF Transcript_18520/g.51995 Transcript_18520/m.51995 type:complete len:673 (-) Transcript_18520:973-2991(-)